MTIAAHGDSAISHEDITGYTLGAIVLSFALVAAAGAAIIVGRRTHYRLTPTAPHQ